MSAEAPVEISASEPSASGGAGFRLLSLKASTLIFATLMSLLGSFGPFLLIEKFDSMIAARAAEMRAIETRIATLRSTQNEYFNAYVQSNLLFALNPADSSVNRGITGQMYRLAIYDRAFPFRAMMGEMAIAGVFNFKTTNDQYNKLSDAARADFTLESYNALNQFEREILDRAHVLQDQLQDRYFAAQDEKAAAEAGKDRRRTWLALMTALGTILLLAANLIKEART
jgi:hypothetical protein